MVLLFGGDGYLGSWSWLLVRMSARRIDPVRLEPAFGSSLVARPKIKKQSREDRGQGPNASIGNHYCIDCCGACVRCLETDRTCHSRRSDWCSCRPSRRICYRASISSRRVTPGTEFGGACGPREGATTYCLTESGPSDKTSKKSLHTGKMQASNRPCPLRGI